MKHIKLIIITFVFICLSMQLGAQQVSDARSTGMAFSTAADTRGLDHIGLNPATLALKHRFNFEFNLLSANVGVSNNSFSKALYDQYFTTGATLNSDDKNNILGSIPLSGMGGHASANLNTIALYMPNFSLALVGMGAGNFNIPREVAELALNGNDEAGRVYDFSNVDGFGWGGGAALISFAKAFHAGGDAFLDMFAVGITSKYITGLGYGEVMNADGKFYNLDENNNTLRLDGSLTARTSMGGSGYGFDLGIIAEAKEQHLTFSASLVNAMGSIKWTRDNEMIELSVQTDSLAIASDGIADSLIVDEDTTYAADAFSSQLPRVFDFGVAYRPFNRMLVTAEFEQGLSSSMGGTTSSRLAFGTELTYIPLLPIRTGFSVGGRHGFSMAFGTGLDLRYWHLDIGIVNHGGLGGGSARGLSVSATSRLRF